MEPERIAERLWPGRVRAVEPLGGGITNRNFTVELDGDTQVVLRIGGKDTSLLGIDRHLEKAASQAAAKVGLGPEVVAFLEPEGYLVTRYVEGEAVPFDEIRHPDVLGEVVTMLRQFHESPPIPGRFDPFRVIEAYYSTAAARGVAPPHVYAEAKALADMIEARRGRQPLHPCHNDLLNANFIRGGGRIWIVDWEYAGMGDRFFDLANFSTNHRFGEHENEELLRAYFGKVRDEDIRTLRLLSFMSDFREAMWGVVQQAISELEVDFVSYADEHFERLQRTASEPAFQAALAA